MQNQNQWPTVIFTLLVAHFTSPIAAFGIILILASLAWLAQHLFFSEGK